MKIIFNYVFRWKEAMDMRSKLYGCPMVGMIKFMPEVCQVIIKVIACFLD